MCRQNNNGEYPSCLEAKFDGPGCEEYSLCFECADALKKQLDVANLQLGEITKAFRESAEFIAHMVVDNDDLRPALRLEGKELLVRWQRGEHLKDVEKKEGV